MIEPVVACLLISHESSGIGIFLSGKSRHAQESRTRRILAPRARFELATLRLTAECSTVELPGNRLRCTFSFYYIKQIHVMTLRYDVGMLNTWDHPGFCDSYASFSSTVWMALGDKIEFSMPTRVGPPIQLHQQGVMERAMGIEQN